MKKKQTASLENKIEKGYGNIAGIIVLKDDNAVYENYFNQCSENDPVHIFSVTKSIISMLFGIAIDQGCIKNPMTAPYKYKFNPYPKYFSSEDWVRSSLDFLGGNGKIGKFKYAPIIGIDILSGILIKATGKSVIEFAQDNLFSLLESTPSQVRVSVVDYR